MMQQGASRVLIAERDPAVRRRLFKSLLDADIFSDSASDGPDALLRITERPYALMLLDLGLPRLDLTALLTYVQGLSERERPIVIAFGTSDMTRDLDCELVQIVMRRPVNVSHVTDLVQSCVRETEAARDGGLGYDKAGELTA